MRDPNFAWDWFPGVPHTSLPGVWVGLFLSQSGVSYLSKINFQVSWPLLSFSLSQGSELFESAKIILVCLREPLGNSSVPSRWLYTDIQICDVILFSGHWSKQGSLTVLHLPLEGWLFL